MKKDDELDYGIERESEEDSLDRTSYDEDIGIRYIDPEISERIRERIRRERLRESGLETRANSNPKSKALKTKAFKQISSDVLAKASNIVNLNVSPGEYVSKTEYLMRLRRLNELGIPLGHSMSDYRKMSPGRIYHIFNGLASKIRGSYQSS